MESNIILLLVILASSSASWAAENGTNCTVYRDNLAGAISEFTSCAIEHSRPITLCESCVDYYLKVNESYQNLSTFSNEFGKCIDDYINLDRLQIVETLYTQSTHLWNKAKCYECFEIVNGSLTHNRSEETKMFNDLLEMTLNCINQTNTDKNVYCDMCIDEYLGLDAYYKSISDINANIGVCMDVVDLMNGTRALWAKDCCEYRKQHNEYIFLATTAVACFITILFYILAKLCTDMKQHTIFRQSRFAESLNQGPSRQ